MFDGNRPLLRTKAKVPVGSLARSVTRKMRSSPMYLICKTPLQMPGPSGERNLWLGEKSTCSQCFLELVRAIVPVQGTHLPKVEALERHILGTSALTIRCAA